MKLYVIVLLLITTQAFAAEVTVTGKIIQLVSDRTLNPGSWMKVEGVKEVGECRKSANGHVLMYFDEDLHSVRQFNIAVAAKAADKAVIVRISDEQPFRLSQSSNMCLVKFIAME